VTVIVAVNGPPSSTGVKTTSRVQLSFGTIVGDVLPHGFARVDVRVIQGDVCDGEIIRSRVGNRNLRCRRSPDVHHPEIPPGWGR